MTISEKFLQGSVGFVPVHAAAVSSLCFYHLKLQNQKVLKRQFCFIKSPPMKYLQLQANWPVDKAQRIKAKSHNAYHQG